MDAQGQFFKMDWSNDEQLNSTRLASLLPPPPLRPLAPSSSSEAYVFNWRVSGMSMLAVVVVAVAVAGGGGSGGGDSGSGSGWW